MGGIVALLPSGSVEFLHPDAGPLIDEWNKSDGKDEKPLLEQYILRDPWVDINKFHLSAPAIAFVEITNLCNLKCEHCYAWSGPKRDSEMSTDLILSLLDQFAELGVIQVFLTGGEVFAHKDCLKIIKHARSKPFSTQIFTNGTLITCLLYTSPSPRDQRGSRMPSSA